jgi:hypothetical protein
MGAYTCTARASTGYNGMSVACTDILTHAVRRFLSYGDPVSVKRGVMYNLCAVGDTKQHEILLSAAWPAHPAHTVQGQVTATLCQQQLQLTLSEALGQAIYRPALGASVASLRQLASHLCKQAAGATPGSLKT